MAEISRRELFGAEPASVEVSLSDILGGSDLETSILSESLSPTRMTFRARRAIEPRSLSAEEEASIATRLASRSDQVDKVEHLLSEHSLLEPEEIDDYLQMLAIRNAFVEGAQDYRVHRVDEQLAVLDRQADLPDEVAIEVDQAISAMERLTDWVRDIRAGTDTYGRSSYAWGTRRPGYQFSRGPFEVRGSGRSGVLYRHAPIGWGI